MTVVDRSRLPPAGPEAPFAFPEIARRRLTNGLEIWTIEHRRLPVVACLLLVRAGAAADPLERPGLAALTADLLDEGSGDRSALGMHEALARIGAQFDTEVGPDATALSLTTLSRFAAEGFGLLAEMIARPRFEPSEFERIRRLRVNRLAQFRDVPQAVADRVFTERLFPGHPYGHLAVGTQASLEGATLDDVVRFHAQAYDPGQTVLIIVGDAAHVTLAERAQEAFETWAPPPRGRPVANVGDIDRPTRPADRLILVPRPGAAQSELRIGHVAVGRATPDYHALLVLNMVLGGQFVSRLNLNLRERRGLTYGARTTFDFRRGRGPFVFQSSVQADATGLAIREAVKEIEDVRGARPPTDAELTTARAALTRGYPRNFETAEQIARATTQLALYDLSGTYFSEFVPKVSALDAETVIRAARTHLDPEELLVVAVGDSERITSQLGELGWGPAVEVPAE